MEVWVFTDTVSYLTGSLQPKSLVLGWHNFQAPLKPAEQVALTHLFKMCLENVFEKQPVVCFIGALRKIVYSNKFHMTLSMVDKRFKIAFLKDYFFIDFIFLKCSEAWIYENIWIVRDILCSEIKLNILKCQLRFDHIYIFLLQVLLYISPQKDLQRSKVEELTYVDLLSSCFRVFGHEAISVRKLSPNWYVFSQPRLWPCFICSYLALLSPSLRTLFDFFLLLTHLTFILVSNSPVWVPNTSSIMLHLTTNFCSELLISVLNITVICLKPESVSFFFFNSFMEI